MKVLTSKKYLTTNLIGLGIVVLAALAALNIGPEHITIFSKGLSSIESAILFNTRLPRIVLGLIVGVTLASTGCAFQSLLRNPLADPYILGVSGGAALGSVIGVALKLSFIFVSLTAFVFAFFSMILIYWIAETRGRLPSHTLLLTGVIYNAFAFAIIMLIHSTVTMEQAHEILFLLVGSLEIYDTNTLAIIGVIVATGFSLLLYFSGKMNLMAVGDETAFNLGIDIEKFRRWIFFAASLMIGAVVSVSGLIGFVGLFIPHTLRMIIGPDHRLLIPASALAGGAFLIIADTIARTALTGGQYETQLPVGVITALIGGPFFVFILKRQLKGSK